MFLEGFYAAFTLFSQGSTIWLKGFENEKKIKQLLECLFKYFWRLLQSPLQGFTNLLQGFYKALHNKWKHSNGFSKDFTRLSQCFHTVHKVFRKLIEGF